MWDNNKEFKVDNYFNENGNLYEKYRLTLDYKEDYYVISKYLIHYIKKINISKLKKLSTF